MIVGMARQLWRRFDDWRWRRRYLRLAFSSPEWCLGDPESEAIGAGLRCPSDLQPCRCVDACEREPDPELDRAGLAEARGKFRDIGRYVQFLRRLEIEAPDDPVTAENRREAERILARLWRVE